MAEITLQEINAGAKVPQKTIQSADESYRKNVLMCAERVKNNDNIRVILLAGPSGSGKTTTANVLCDTIEKLGEECVVVSLDNFYLSHDDPRYPLDEEGDRDYERPDSLDLELLRAVIKNITDGKPFSVPKYDFVEGRATSIDSFPAMPEGCVIIEGLHALNPAITDGLNPEKILKIFISVSTNINDGIERILSGRKSRFVRRMVRDSIFRGADAVRTLDLWKNVLDGEDLYLYPYRHLADISFNTFHAFESGIMKERAIKLITEGEAKNDAYAQTVLRALERIEPIDEALVPADSLMREFIGGGTYEEIY